MYIVFFFNYHTLMLASMFVLVFATIKADFYLLLMKRNDKNFASVGTRYTVRKDKIGPYAVRRLKIK